jgi:hypothetical protein
MRRQRRFKDLHTSDLIERLEEGGDEDHKLNAMANELALRLVSGHNAHAGDQIAASSTFWTGGDPCSTWDEWARWFLSAKEVTLTT